MKRRLPLIVLLLVLSLVAAACGSDTVGSGDPSEDSSDTESPSDTDTESEEPTEDDTTGGGGDLTGDFKIAYQGPLTGDNAALGVNMVRGVELAINELTESGDLGDITLTIEELDSQGDPAQAPALANQAAADDSVLAVIGPAFSGETAASGPIYEEAGLPFVSPSATNPDLSEEGWTYFFRTVATDAAQGPVAATFITENLGFTQVAVIDDASEYGKGLADIVEESLVEQGAEGVAREGI
jgi:branched-chain amino acid transport system substrate-binding protein